MQKILTAVSRTGGAVPAVRLDFVGGLHAALGSNIIIPRDGVYQIVTTQPAYVSAHPPAGAAPGSTFFAPGVPQHLAMRLLDTLRTAAVGEAGRSFRGPARNGVIRDDRQSVHADDAAGRIEVEARAAAADPRRSWVFVALRRVRRPRPARAVLRYVVALRRAIREKSSPVGLGALVVLTLATAHTSRVRII